MQRTYEYSHGAQGLHEKLWQVRIHSHSWAMALIGARGTCFQSRWPPALCSSSMSFKCSPMRVMAEDAKKNAKSTTVHLQ